MAQRGRGDLYEWKCAPPPCPAGHDATYVPVPGSANAAGVSRVAARCTPACADGSPRHPDGDCDGVLVVEHHLEGDTLKVQTYLQEPGSSSRHRVGGAHLELVRTVGNAFQPAPTDGATYVVHGVERYRVYAEATTDEHGDAAFDLTKEPLHQFIVDGTNAIFQGRMFAIDMTLMTTLGDGRTDRKEMAFSESNVSKSIQGDRLRSSGDQQLQLLDAELSKLQHPLPETQFEDFERARERFRGIAPSQVTAFSADEAKHYQAIARAIKASEREYNAATTALAVRMEPTIAPQAHAEIERKYRVRGFGSDDIVELCTNGMWMVYSEVTLDSPAGPRDVTLCVVHEGRETMVLSRGDCGQNGAVDQMFRADTAGARCRTRPHM